jgi:hypothetical protein
LPPDTNKQTKLVQNRFILGIKLHILFLATIILNLSAFADEKFLNIRGTVLEEESKSAVSGYSIKVVQDRLDSTTNCFFKIRISGLGSGK